MTLAASPVVETAAPPTSGPLVLQKYVLAPLQERSRRNARTQLAALRAELADAAEAAQVLEPPRPDARRRAR